MRANVLLSLLALVFLAAPNAWSAPKYEVLHAFTGGNDGGVLWGGLVLDRHGNVYGTTNYWGPYGGGTVFDLTPISGEWRLTVLHGFCSQSGCADGNASTAGLVVDAVGNLYGTAGRGGTYERGTVFELSPQTHGKWTETVLYSFDDGPTVPYGGVVMDPSGDLFGTGGGYAYELSPSPSGWALTDLHEFTGENGDGYGPLAGMILDTTGNLYGTTEYDGANGGGTVYALIPGRSGWQEQILHSFPASPSDGRVPGVGALVRDQSGRLYGTTAQGGANICDDTGCGTIFRLTPGANGHWKETILYSFTPKGNGGFGPGGGVVIDKAGNIYGTTFYGGTIGCGVVYKLAPQAKDKWNFTVLHSFAGYDGCEPDANLVLDTKGTLYGTTTLGGTHNLGVAFEITP